MPLDEARSGRRRLLAPLLSAAAAVLIAATIGAVALNTGDDHPSASGRRSDSATTTTTTTTNSTSAAASSAVHVKLLNHDGYTYGVGMPVIAYFSQRITDARAFQQATTATVNGKPIQVAWFFEDSSAGNGLEAHLRPRTYWPAHASIHVRIPVQNLSAGGALHFDNSLTLDFRTGAEQIATVDGHYLTVTSDGKWFGRYPVSLGADATRTRPGTKVIMDRKPTIDVRGPDHTGPAKDAMRLTDGGEYLIAAPWKIADIKAHKDTTEGSTDLLPADAAALYNLLRIGDVVRFPTATGTPLDAGSGYSDWNVSWKTWLTGGKVRTR